MQNHIPVNNFDDLKSYFRSILYLSENVANPAYYYLITDNDLPAFSQVECFAERCNVEIFFKSIEQNYNNKESFGPFKNVFQFLIWITISTNLLIAIVKKKHDSTFNLFTFAQTLVFSHFETISIKANINTNILLKDLFGKNRLTH